MEPTLRSRAVALVAAYAVAMQMLLSAFLPVASVALADPVGVLCLNDDSDGAGHPVHHDLPCATMCAAMGNGISGPLPPGVVVALATPAIVLARGSCTDWVPPRTAAESPQAPRGPPLA